MGSAIGEFYGSRRRGARFVGRAAVVRDFTIRISASASSPSVARSRSRAPFFIVAAALFVLLMDGNLATPLYAVYRERFGFSGTVLTLVFAVYTAILIPSLLIFGQLSDRVGRRRVIAAALGVAALGLALLATAHSTAWLFAGRAVQGIALGAIVGTAAAALVELSPGGDQGVAAVATVVAQSGGSAAGPLVGGVLAEWAPAPRQLCYLVCLVLTLVMAAAVWRLPEPHPPTGEWRLQRPSVPREVRARFARAGITGAAVWAVGALFLSVVPSYVGQLLDTENLALLGVIPAVMLTAACFVQLVSVRGGMGPQRAQPTGLALLIAGVGVLVLAFPLHSLAPVLAAALLSGSGLGLGYFGAQADVNAIAPPERRGEVTAAFITCMYLGVTVTVIGVGLLSDATSLETAVAAAGALIVTVASAALAWHLLAARQPASAARASSRSR
jgi:MFS family permease